MLPKGWLFDTAALYARVFRRGAELALRNWPIGLLVLPYAVLLQIALVLASPFGIVGGLLLYLLNVACAGAGLSLVEQVIRSGRVRLRDVPSSFAAYFWDLLTLGFVLWGFRLLGSMLPPGSLPWLVFQLAFFVFLNAVPEMIYLGRQSGIELVTESYRFIAENWVEWFPANFVLAACIMAVLQLPIGIVADALAGIVLYFAMIVRGLLFLELSQSSRRSREFRRRSAG